MRYSIDPRERRFVKGYGFLPFARNFNDKYGKYLRNASKTFARTADKEIRKETAKATGDLIGSKIADEITAKPHNKDEVINGIPKERYISPKERQKIIDELKLAEYNNGIPKNSESNR